MPDEKRCANPKCTSIVPLKKGTSYHNKQCLDEHNRWKTQMSLARTAEQKKLQVASRTTTTTMTENVVNYEERRIADRAQVYFDETDEQLREAHRSTDVETSDETIRRHVISWGTLICPAGLVAAVGVDIAVFLIGGNTNIASIVAILMMTIFFEAILMVMTFALHRFRKRMILAPKDALPEMQKQFRVAAWTWAALAFVSAVAQFAALAGASLLSPTMAVILPWSIIALRAIGTTSADFAIAIAIPIEVKTVADKIKELTQEARDRRAMAEAKKEQLEADKYVKQLFLDMERQVLPAGRVTDIQEVGQHVN